MDSWVPFPFYYPLSPLRSPGAKPHASCEILTKPTGVVVVAALQLQILAISLAMWYWKKENKKWRAWQLRGSGPGDGRTQGRQGFSAPNHSLFSGQEAENWTANTNPYPPFFLKKKLYISRRSRKRRTLTKPQINLSRQMIFRARFYEIGDREISQVNE
jgi:hypothetical protein